MGRLLQTGSAEEVAEHFATTARGHLDAAAAQLAGLERHVRKTAGRAATNADRMGRELQQRTAEVVTRTSSALRERPMIGAAIALAAGILIVSALTRRK